MAEGPVWVEKVNLALQPSDANDRPLLGEISPVNEVNEGRFLECRFSGWFGAVGTPRTPQVYMVQSGH